MKNTIGAIWLLLGISVALANLTQSMANWQLGAGLCFLVIGLTILAYPVRKKAPLHERIRIWAERHNYHPLHNDEEVVNYENSNGVHIHYNILNNSLKIYSEKGRKLIFNGKIHHISQLERLMEIVH